MRSLQVFWRELGNRTRALPCFDRHYLFCRVLYESMKSCPFVLYRAPRTIKLSIIDLKLPAVKFVSGFEPLSQYMNVS